MITIVAKCFRFLFSTLFYKIKFYIFTFKFRKLNAHNMTFPATMFDTDIVTIGKHTYGELYIKSYCKDVGEKLIIGNYVSIANDVKFLLGGNHQIYTITTYPLKTFLTNSDFQEDATSKGPIIVEDEVWFGTNAIILSGVKIGKGAIIAAGSIVTKDVPPYAIVGGNPAQIIKYRFNEELRSALTDFSLSNIPEIKIIEHIEDFYQMPDLDKIESIKKLEQNKN